MIKYIFPSLFLLLTTISNAQSIDVDISAIGLILSGNDISGTSFVLNSKRQVVTCAHVIDTTKDIFYVPIGLTIIKHKLKLVKLLPEYDLALLQSDTDLCNRSLFSDKSVNFVANQHLFYMGYNSTLSNDTLKSLQVHNAIVSSVGQTFNGSASIDFIEFIGAGIPGYSGGPVINDKGKVVGLIREAWFKQGIKGGQIQLINRAYSVLPITKFQ